VLAEANPSVVLVGLESAGKSALFRALSRQSTGDEANFRGSTVVCRTCRLAECECDLVDTPGIRVGSDSATTALALAALEDADAVVLVLRAPELQRELRTLLGALQLGARRLAVAITFADKVVAGLEEVAEGLRRSLGVPVVTVNARAMGTDGRSGVLDAIRAARTLTTASPDDSLVQIRSRAPGKTPFEHRVAGPPLALVAMLGLLAVPVMLAFKLADWLQPLADASIIGPLVGLTANLPSLPAALLTGSYGLLTLGVYSFIWAFPVVLLLGVTSSLAEETGLHDRITSALDPWLRYVGLSGRDLVFVLTGFGCNVVAVLQSRACSACSRRVCVSLIAFGSACSYQIGASLSLFGSAGRPWMFGPYMSVVFVVGLLHTKLWYGALKREAALSLHEQAFLQAPSPRALVWRLGVVVKQFLRQAMPIFLLLCLASAALEYAGVMNAIARSFAPALWVFHLPSEVALPVVLSIFRKDGMLLLNTSNGSLLRSLSGGQLFVLVYLASTLTACLVTLWTVRQELGWRVAGRLAGRQALTSIMSAWLIAQIAA
jgi:ferrous iron transport protein B